QAKVRHAASLSRSLNSGPRRQRQAGSLSDLRLQAAGDFEYLARNIIRQRRCKKQNRARTFVRCARAAHWDHRGRAIQPFSRNADSNLGFAALNRLAFFFRLSEASVDASECNRVDLNVELAPLVRERFGQSDYAGFARGIIRRTRIASRA